MTSFVSEAVITRTGEARLPADHASPDERALRVLVRLDDPFTGMRRQIFALVTEECRQAEAKGRQDAALDLETAGFADAARHLRANT